MGHGEAGRFPDSFCPSASSRASLGSSRWCFSPALMSWLGGFVALKYLKWSFFHLWFWRFCFKGNLYFLRLLFVTRRGQILSHCLHSFHKSGTWDILASAFSELGFIDLQHLPLVYSLQTLFKEFWTHYLKQKVICSEIFIHVHGEDKSLCWSGAWINKESTRFQHSAGQNFLGLLL